MRLLFNSLQPSYDIETEIPSGWVLRRDNGVTFSSSEGDIAHVYFVLRIEAIRMVFGEASALQQQDGSLGGRSTPGRGHLR